MANSGFIIALRMVPG